MNFSGSTRGRKKSPLMCAVFYLFIRVAAAAALIDQQEQHCWCIKYYYLV